MAKKTYLVTDPNGTVHTRKTDRVYTHAVLGRPSFDGALKSAARISMTDKANFKYYKEQAESYPNHINQSVTSEDDIARYRVTIETFKTADLYAQDRADERVANIRKLESEGYYKAFQVLGFCGRPDLAQKMASKSNQHYIGLCDEVVIAEAILKS